MSLPALLLALALAAAPATQGSDPGSEDAFVPGAVSPADAKALFDTVLRVRQARDNALVTLQATYTGLSWGEGGEHKAVRIFARDGNKIAGTEYFGGAAEPRATYAYDGAVVALRYHDRNSIDLSRPADPNSEIALPEPGLLSETLRPSFIAGGT